jgi:hypothetical protein
MIGRNSTIPDRERLHPRINPVAREGWLVIRAVGHVLYETLDKAVDTGIRTATDEIEFFMARNATQASLQAFIDKPSDTDTSQSA